MFTPISSPSNPKVKEIVQLLTKARARKDTGRCVVEGEREILRAVQAGWRGHSLWLKGEVEVDFTDSFDQVYFTSERVFEKLAYRSGTEYAVAVFETPSTDLNPQTLADFRAVLVVEGLEKPGNLGALLRTSLAAGFDAVLLADPALEPFGPNVIRNATGALFEQRLLVGTTAQVQAALATAGFTTWITHMHTNATDLFAWEPAERTAFVLGEEARGLSSLWLDQEYENLIIPMSGAAVDSLNVSVAAAVLMYHWRYKSLGK